ncbi:MAG TPA: FUSC family protein [Acidimicrobiales bacterium]|nr:FUSC family protein [Acidimicrobiales bacterium]
MHDPNRQSLRKAARVTVVATICFMVGNYVVKDLQLTVMATFTAVALTGIADFGGSVRGRTRANLAATAAGLALVPLGTWVSEVTWTASVAMFLVVLVVSFSGIYSGYFAAGSTALILFYVVASGIPAPTSAIPARLEGVALAGALATLAAVALWPLYLSDSLRGRFGSGVAAVSELLSALSFDADVGPEELERRRAVVRERALDIRTRQATMAAQPPAGPTDVQRAQMSLLHGIERMGDVINRLIDDPAPVVHASSPVRASREALVATMVRSLDACAKSLRDRGEPPEIEPVLEAKRDFTALSEQALSELLARDSDHELFASRVDRAVEMRELATAVLMTTVHTRIADGVDAIISTEMPGPATLRPIVTGDRPAWDKWARRARTNLSLGSVHLRNSLRLAAGLTVARVAVGALDLQHGFWVVFATLTILKTTASTTRATAVQALAGTLLGFGAAAGLAVIFGGHLMAYAAVLPVVIFIAFYTPAVVNFVVGQACFTVLIVVLFNILQPLGWKIGLLRLEDVAAGAAIGVAIGLLAWPRGASGQLRRTLADLFDSGRGYATRTARGLLPGVAAPEDIQELRRRVLAAAVRTEDVFAQYLAEGKDATVAPEVWSDIIGAGHRLWYSADVIARIETPEDAPGPCAAFVGALAGCATTLSDGYGNLAHALRTGAPARGLGSRHAVTHQLGPQASGCARAMEGSSQPKELMSGVHLFELRSWLGELTDDLRELGQLVSTLGPAPAQGEALAAAVRDNANKLPATEEATRI